VDEVQPGALQKVLNHISGRPEERIISTVMLRSLKQARYEAQNLGHFGLAATYYTHFTSPIRRYPDLIVHRILRETFSSGDISTKRKAKLAAMLPAIALHSSERERAAAEAERETVSLKTVEYMAQFVGEHFDGIINGVTAFGIFVELDNGVEGLVRVSSMEDDYYQYVEEQYSLIGERSHKIYRLGDAVKVILVRVSPEERNIDFVLESNSAWIERAANRRPSGGRPQSYGAKSQASDTSGNSKKVASAGKNRGSKAKKAVVTRVKPKPKRNKPKKK
jgi:ribonuclease R